jgi:hypothetical protein
MASSGNGQSSGLPSSLTASLALLVAALAAIGLTGAALLRAVRNNPGEIGFDLGLAVAGGAAIALAQILFPTPTDAIQTSTAPEVTNTEVISTKTTSVPGEPEKSVKETTTTQTVVSDAARPQANGRSRWRGWLRLGLIILGVFLLVYSVLRAVNVGTGAVSDREGPLVSLQAGSISAVPGSPKARNIEITVSVRAVGMSTSNDVAVQVLGLTKMQAWVNESNVRACETNHTFNTFGQYEELKDSAGATILSWNRLGPDASGSVEASWKLLVQHGKYAGLCAWAIFGGDLRPNDKNKRKNPSTSAAYLRLDSQT